MSKDMKKINKIIIFFVLAVFICSGNLLRASSTDRQEALNNAVKLGARAIVWYQLNSEEQENLQKLNREEPRLYKWAFALGERYGNISFDEAKFLAGKENYSSTPAWVKAFNYYAAQEAEDI